VLAPGSSVLACTKETVDVPCSVIGWISTKGNIARGFLTAHLCDGQIDPGYKGRITLELVNHGPLKIELRPGMPIANLYLYRLTQSSKGYDGAFWGSNRPTAMVGAEDQALSTPRPQFLRMLTSLKPFLKLRRRINGNTYFFRGPSHTPLVSLLWFTGLLQIVGCIVLVITWIKLSRATP
jgi:hypothetical protein